MTLDIKNYISKCETCQTVKAPNDILRPPMKAQYVIDRPFQKIYVDFLGSYPRTRLGNIGIFLILDHLTKFPLILPVKKLSANVIVNFLKDYVFSTFGTPEIVFSDNGQQFKSKLFEGFLRERGVKHVFTAIYSPQANASERVNRSILNGIRSYIKNDQTHWDKYLADIGEALRTFYHQTIQCSPYYALFGQQMLGHGEDYELVRKLESFDGDVIGRRDRLDILRQDLKDNIAKAFESSANRYNLRSREKQYQVGERVLRRSFAQSDAIKRFNAKLSPKFIKARVVARKGNSLYILEDEDTGKTETFHLKDIKDFKI